jgi:hypothetical protein
MAQEIVLGDKARENWYRYQYCRDEGHHQFVQKARRCEDFFAGQQWDAQDLANLRMSRRPAMTINKILSTVDHMVGEQLYNRSSIGFRPARGLATSGIADSLTKVGMNISQANDLAYVRTDVFADGIITSRGFFDIRLNMNSNFMGDVVITRAPSDTVILDPDSSEYDPDSWQDVQTSRWVPLNDIRMFWGPEVARELDGIPANYSPYGDIDDDFIRTGTFGSGITNRHSRHSTWHPQGADKYYRILDRQHFEMVRSEVFVDAKLGEITPVPTTWRHNRISLYLEQNPNAFVLRKPVRRVRWTGSTGHITLHDHWSPYRHFTIVPYFPRLRSGRTIGVVEHLIGPQEILNKSRSQELHILSTSANSGWVVTQNNLVNMDEKQLEQKGAETGLVLVVKDPQGIEKIKPNQVPTGLDRVSFKAEEDMKNISGVSDALTGFAREDVSAKALKANQAVGGTSFAPMLDNLARTDKLLGRRILDLVQTFYVEPRLIHIIGTKPGQENETLNVNEVTPEGQILNNLTLGEYEVIITNEPERDSFEASQYDQAVEMRRDLGIPLKDSFIIRMSKLRDKEEIIADMSDQTPEEAAFDKELEQRTRAAELRKLEAEGMDREADATLKTVRAAKEQSELSRPGEDDLTPAQLGEAKLKMLESQQEHNNRLRELNLEFMFNIRELREKARLEVQVQKALPPPPKTQSKPQPSQ